MNSLKILNTISNAIVSIIAIFAISKYTHIIENIEILPIKTVDITFFYIYWNGLFCTCCTLSEIYVPKRNRYVK